MSTSDKTDHARGWLYVEGLLLEDKIAELESRGDEAPETRPAAEGAPPERVPSVEELVARAGVLAKREEERGKVDHARGWAYVEGLLAEEDAGTSTPSESPPSLERLLAKAQELAKKSAASGGTPSVMEVRPLEGARRPNTTTARVRRTMWLAAAALGALLSVFALRNRAAIEAALEGEPIKPDDEWLPWKPTPTPNERAAPIRQQAFAACGAALWSTCEAKLDEARQIDPAGESAPPVVAARTAIADAAKSPIPERLPKAPLPRPVP
jgi:hypothetical protein